MIAASDSDGDPLSFTLVPGTGPADGEIEALNASTGDFTYAPPRDFTGQTTFDIRVADNNGGENVATITIDVACPGTQAQCGFDKFDLADDPALSNAREPSIAVDTALRVNVAFVEDNAAGGGSSGDLYVYQTAPLGRSFSRLNGSGVNGALNDVGAAARPDLVSSLVLPTTIMVTWDEANNIVTEVRNDLGGAWADVSGAPNTVSATDPALTLDAITGSPLLVWTSNANAANNDVLLAYNDGFLPNTPGAWAQLDAPLDLVAANSARSPAVTSDDIPGGGTNVFGRNTIAWAETTAGVSQIVVRQCANASDGLVANCALLGSILNQSATTSAVTPAIAIPNAATAILIGESPTNPRPVVAFVEAGRLFVKRFDPASNQWSLLADTAADGALNVAANGTAAEPAITVDVLGRYTVAWSEVTPDNGRTGVYVKRLTAPMGGNAWTPLEGILNCDPDMAATAPDLAVDTLGRPYVTFQEVEPGGDTRIVVLSFEN